MNWSLSGGTKLPWPDGSSKTISQGVRNMCIAMVLSSSGSSTLGDCSMLDAHLVAPRMAKHEKNSKFRNPPDARVSQRYL